MRESAIRMLARLERQAKGDRDVFEQLVIDEIEGAGADAAKRSRRKRGREGEDGVEEDDEGGGGEDDMVEGDDDIFRRGRTKRATVAMRKAARDFALRNPQCDNVAAFLYNLDGAAAEKIDGIISRGALMVGSVVSQSRKRQKPEQ